MARDTSPPRELVLELAAKDAAMRIDIDTGERVLHGIRFALG